MGRFNGIKLTSKGLRLQAKAQTGTPLIIKGIVVGDGYLPENADVVQMTALISPIADAHTDIIDNTETGDGFARLEARISSGNTAFFLREIGVIATDPDEGDILYAYTNAGDYADFIPTLMDNATEQDITLITAIGNAENVDVNITLDAGVGRKEFNDLKKTVDSKTHVEVVYSGAPTDKPKTVYFILDEDDNKPNESDSIDSVSYDNVIFAEQEPDSGENWFQGKVNEGGGADVEKITIENGLLKVLREPDSSTTFINE